MKPLSFITALLLFIAIAKLPDDYYTFLRIAVTMDCFVIIVSEYDKRNHFWHIPFVVIGVLFNPFIPLPLYNKNLWIPVDIVSAILFLAKVFVPLRARGK